MDARLIEVSLRVRDLERAVEFYRDTLGVPVVAGDDASTHYEAFWGEWQPGQADMLMLLLYRAEADRPPTASVVGFGVADLDEVHSRVMAKGHEVVSDPSDKPWGRQATYRDPDGNLVSVAETPK